MSILSVANLQDLAGGTNINIGGGTPEKIIQATTLSASGTQIDFTGIPSWAKKISVIFNNVSTNGTSYNQIQIGSGSITTTGYASQFWTASQYSNVITTGFGLFSIVSASYNFSGIIFLYNAGSNVWVETGSLAYTNAASYAWTSGGSSPSLSGSLDRVRITTVNGTDSYDNGTIGLIYEG